MKSHGWRPLLVGVLAFVVLVSACSAETDSQASPDDVADAQTDGSAEATGPDGTQPAADATEVDLAPWTEADQQELDDTIDDFFEVRSARAAGRIVELMGRSGEVRFAPWLVDMSQLGLSTRVTGLAIDVLAGLSGIASSNNSFADFARYGTWVESEAIDPGPGYRRWKVGLFGGIDPQFGPLLDSIPDDELLGRIRWGGVRRGGIPELNNPARISAAEASEWITADEIVLGVEIDGESVAYPFRIVGHHELVNDEVAGRPVSLVYCTLCRTGLLFDRRVEGQVLDFQTSGLLTNSNKVMVDVQTDTLWHHAAGVGIGGPLLDVRLDVLPMETTTWAEWLADHPDTEVLDIPPPIFFEDPERPPIAYGYEAAGPYASYYEQDEVWFPIRQTSGQLADKAQVLGVLIGDEALAISVDDVVGGPSRYFGVGTAAVVVVPGSVGARVYDASGSALLDDGLVDGAEVVISSSDSRQAVVEDGTTLPRLAVEQGFWFSWFDRHPTSRTWTTG